MNTIKISKLLDKTTDLKDEDITIVSSNENSTLKSKRVSFIKIFDYIKTKLYGLDYVVKSVNDRKADSDGNITISHVESADKATQSDTSTKLSQNRTISLTGDVTGSVTTNLGSNFSINTTVANNSHTHTIENITNLQNSLNNKANNSHTHTSENITNLNNYLNTYLSSNGYINILPDNPDYSGDITNLQNFQTMINSMLSENHAYYYIDSVNGSDTNDGSLNKPFKSIHKAISTANKRRFIGNSQCYIRILNDITLTLSTTDIIVEQSTQQRIDFYHPDLVQTKYFRVQGWDGINKTLKNRKINFIHPTSKLNVSVFRTYANLYTQNLEFDGGVNDDVINGCDHKDTYTILKGQNSNVDVSINECTFSNLNVALARPTYVSRCRFNNIGTCIINNVATYTEIESSIVRNCDIFCKCDTQSLTKITKGNANYPLDIESRVIFKLTAGANITFDYVNSTFSSYNIWDVDKNLNFSKRNPNSNYENVYMRIEKLYKDSSGNKVKRNIIGDCEYENPSANIGDANYMTLKNKPTINQFVNDLITNANITNNQFANYNSNGYYHIADTYDQLLTLMIYGKNK